MSVATILSRCDVLPGNFVLLSEYQEQGILCLEEWHANHQQNIVTELISSGYLDSDYNSSDTDDASDINYSSSDSFTEYDCDDENDDDYGKEYKCDKVEI